MTEPDSANEGLVDIDFYNPDLPFEARARDLVGRLTLEEKAGQMLHEAPAIERLGVPAYNWWNECIHGVARAGVATVFPQAIGLASLWDDARLQEVAGVIADEARAKHHEFVKKGDRGYYKGLTFWAPNINIFRDPRWGRGHETYGECPYLTGRLAVAFCRGLQGQHDRYLKLVATPKHFAVHSGPESLRHEFDAVVGEKDLWETYLPAFFDAIVEAGAQSVMSAYNRTNGEACCSSRALLAETLRGKWGFTGYVVSDCWAVKDLHDNHGLTPSPEASAAAAVKAGCDLNCGCTYQHIPAAVRSGLLEHADLDASLVRLFVARLRLGMFDPPASVPYQSIPYEVNDSPAHSELARAVARESHVLLKNDGMLPFSKNLKNIAVIGPNADDPVALVGNYFGTPSAPVTPLAGIRGAVSKQTRVWFAPGCTRQGAQQDGVAVASSISEALSAAERADAVVLCLGLSADIEGEQGDTGNSEAGGDKLDLRLPGLQQQLLERVVQVGKPTVAVVLAGSALDLGWAHVHAGALVQAWYPGQAAGLALADLLFGEASPSGRLPVTFPRSLSDLPDFTDYSMRGRTYRYAEQEPLYPFGYGLSYSRFAYSQLSLSGPAVDSEGSVTVRVRVRNAGPRASFEVVQLYVSLHDAPCRVPRYDLRGFRRVLLEVGAVREVVFVLDARALSLIDERGRRWFHPGRATIHAGGSQPDPRSRELTGGSPLSAQLELAGRAAELPY